MNSSAAAENTLGIIGGGQLGRMLAIAAAQMGIQSRFIDPSKAAVAADVADHICAPFDDLGAINSLFETCKAVTFEFENVSQQALGQFSGDSRLAPGLNALSVANDRIREKEFFRKCGLEVAPYQAIENAHELSDSDFIRTIKSAGEQIGFPAILKTCSLGYDGKGQVCIDTAENADRALALKSARRLVLEKKLNFRREVSIIAVRGRDRKISHYPVPENVHKQGILFSSVITEAQPLAVLCKYASRIMDELEYVGVLAIEFFELDDGTFIANEMAPRVHNTGHWTIEGAFTSQFENHVRAVMGLPTGSTALRFPTAMINIIGDNPDREAILDIPGAHLHLYGKEPRPGRKLGHVTIEASDSALLHARFANLSRIIAPAD